MPTQEQPPKKRPKKTREERQYRRNEKELREKERKAERIVFVSALLQEAANLLADATFAVQSYESILENNQKEKDVFLEALRDIGIVIRELEDSLLDPAKADAQQCAQSIREAKKVLQVFFNEPFSLRQDISRYSPLTQENSGITDQKKKDISASAFQSVRDKRRVIAQELGGDDFRDFRKRLLEEQGIRIGVDPQFVFIDEGVKENVIQDIRVEGNAVFFTTTENQEKISALQDQYRTALSQPDTDPEKLKQLREEIARLSELSMTCQEFFQSVQQADIAFAGESLASQQLEWDQLWDALEQMPLSDVTAWMRGEQKLPGSFFPYDADALPSFEEQTAVEMIDEIVNKRVRSYVESVLPQVDWQSFQYTAVYASDTDEVILYANTTPPSQPMFFELMLSFDPEEDRATLERVVTELQADAARTEEERKNLFLRSISDAATLHDIAAFLQGDQRLPKSHFLYTYNTCDDALKAQIDAAFVDVFLKKANIPLRAKEAFSLTLSPAMEADQPACTAILTKTIDGSSLLPILFSEQTVQQAQKELQNTARSVFEEFHQSQVDTLANEIISDTIAIADVIAFYGNPQQPCVGATIQRSIESFRKREHQNRLQEAVRERLERHLVMNPGADVVLTIDQATSSAKSINVVVRIGTRETLRFTLTGTEDDNTINDHRISIETIRQLAEEDEAEKKRKEFLKELQQKINQCASLADFFLLYTVAATVPADIHMTPELATEVHNSAQTKARTFLPDPQNRLNDVGLRLLEQPFQGSAALTMECVRASETLYSFSMTAATTAAEMQAHADQVIQQRETQVARLLEERRARFIGFLSDATRLQQPKELIAYYKGDSSAFANESDYVPFIDIADRARPLLESAIIQAARNVCGIDADVSVTIAPPQTQGTITAVDTCALRIEYGMRSLAEGFHFSGEVTEGSTELLLAIEQAREDAQKLEAFSTSDENKDLFKKSPLQAGTVLCYRGVEHIPATADFPFVRDGELLVVERIDNTGNVVLRYDGARIPESPSLGQNQPLWTNAFQPMFQPTADGQPIKNECVIPQDRFLELWRAQTDGNCLEYATRWMIDNQKTRLTDEQGFSFADILESIGIPDEIGAEMFWPQCAFSPVITDASGNFLAKISLDPGDLVQIDLFQQVDPQGVRFAIDMEDDARVYFFLTLEQLHEALPRPGARKRDDGIVFEGDYKKFGISPVAETAEGSEAFFAFFEKVTRQTFPKKSDGTYNVDAIAHAPIFFQDNAEYRKTMAATVAAATNKAGNTRSKPVNKPVNKPADKVVMRDVIGDPGTATIVSIDAQAQTMILSLRNELRFTPDQESKKDSDEKEKVQQLGAQYSRQEISFNDFLKYVATGRYTFHQASRPFAEEKEPFVPSPSSEQQALDSLAENAFPSANASDRPAFWGLDDDELRYSEFAHEGNIVEPVFEWFRLDKNRMYELVRYLHLRRDASTGLDHYAQQAIEELLEKSQQTIPASATSEQRAKLQKEKDLAQWLYDASKQGYTLGLMRRIVSAVAHVLPDFVAGTFLNPWSNQNLYPRTFEAHPAFIAQCKARNLSVHDTLPGLSGFGGLVMQGKGRVHIHPAGKNIPYLYLIFPDHPHYKKTPRFMSVRNAEWQQQQEKDGVPASQRTKFTDDSVMMIHIDEFANMLDRGQITKKGGASINVQESFKPPATVIGSNKKEVSYTPPAGAAAVA